MASLEFVRQMIKHQQSREVLEKGQKPTLTSSVHQLRTLHKLYADTTRASVQDAKNGGAGMQLVEKSPCRDKTASKTPVKKLKKIFLGDLRMLVVAKGGYVILRTLEPAYKYVSIITVVEDQIGNAVFFYATNITADPNPDLNDVLPVGTVFILKEPCIQYTDLGDCMIRCDCPSDMIVLHEGHEMFPLAENIIWKNEIDPKIALDPISKQPKPKTAFEWKERGNSLFKNGKSEYATRCYLIALKELEGLNQTLDDGKNLKEILHLNLSAAYWKHGFFEKALEFAKKCLDADPDNAKALFRAGRSCYQLGNYEDAKQYFEKCCRVCPDDGLTFKELNTTKERLLEQNTGVFDMYKFFLADFNKDEQIIDCSDYVGPIKIVEIPGKGRGIVAVKDIEPGTLLVVSKALVFARMNRYGLHAEVSMDGPNGIHFNQQFVAQVAQLIAKNPNTFGPIIDDLFNMDRSVEDGPSKLFCDPATKKEPIIDVKLIEGVIKSNVFVISPKPGSFLQHYPLDLLSFVPGLYVMPSYFNHSCIPNTFLRSYNGVTFIKAIQFVKAGEELNVCYDSWKNNFLFREKLYKSFKFQCICQLCQQDRKVPNSTLLKRELIIGRCNEIENMLTPEYSRSIRSNSTIIPDLISEIQLLIIEMDATFHISEPVPLKIAKADLYLLLARVYSIYGINEPRKIDAQLECDYNLLKLFGFDPHVMLSSLETGENLISPNVFLDQYVLDDIANVIFLYARLGQNELKTKWIQILCDLENIHSGGDINSLRLEYGHLKNYI